MKIGILGLPSGGKTTFFNALTLLSSNEIDSTKTKSSVAIIDVPDERLDFLSQIFYPKKKTYAKLEIHDFMGNFNPELSSFNTNFSNSAKTFDAFILIVRQFDDETVPHIKGSIDPERDIREFFDDIMLFDLSFIETRLERIEKDLQRLKNKEELIRTKSILMRWNEALQNGIHLRELDFSPEEDLLQRNYQMLTYKPVIVAVNFSEHQITNANQHINSLREKFSRKKVAIEPFCAKIEMELAQIEPKERQIFMEEYNIKESALSRVLKISYSLLGLISFFTVGEDECRAWTITEGTKAQIAAGTIHTDFYHKFIRAEVVSYEDFAKYKSFSKCKEHGVFRLEGKDYIVKDGDIMHIRHS